jgi:oligopeptide/dipeptide ABC transporter ATP-binding protein
MEKKGVLLQVENLAVGFALEEGEARAVDGVSFDLAYGESLGLVGESGCGKSVTAMALLGLLPMPPAMVLSGTACFEGQDLLSMSEEALNRIRGARIGMIFQEPMTSLNPVLPVGEQVAEVLRQHLRLRRIDAAREAVRLLSLVGIEEAEQRARAYPHELSGGMRQRVVIAMAIACKPALIIADEPTTALDAGLRRQILDLLCRLKEDNGGALLLIAHDLGLVARYTERTAVMYSGRIVEFGPTRLVLEHPGHPYSSGLMASRPRLLPAGSRERLPVIPGVVPPPLRRPAGCAFSNRCSLAFAPCLKEEPPLAHMGGGQYARCWRNMATSL